VGQAHNPMAFAKLRNPLSVSTVGSLNPDIMTFGKQLDFE